MGEFLQPTTRLMIIGKESKRGTRKNAAKRSKRESYLALLQDCGKGRRNGGRRRSGNTKGGRQQRTQANRRNRESASRIE